MKSGSRDIQKRMKQQVPRHDMGMKEWIGKAAKFYGCTYTKAENLYYRKGHSIPNEIYVLLRNPPPHSGDISKTNEALKREIEKTKENQRDMDEQTLQLVKGFKLVLEAFEERLSVGAR